MKRILITGVNGFVGRNIATNLMVDNIVFGVGRSLNSGVELSAQYFSMDISNIEAIYSLGNNIHPDIIVHCAAAISNNDLDPLIIDTNIRGLMNMINFAKQVHCSQFIYISSIPIIGIPVKCPITEEHSIYPRTFYHLSKYFGELALQSSLPNTKITILRLPSPVGAGMPSQKILPFFVQKCLNGETLSILGNGRRVQNYINVKDIAVSVRKTIEYSVSGIYNIASLISYSNLELANICIEILQSSSKIVFEGEDADENIQWNISIDKAIRELDFSPSISIEDTITEIAHSMI